MDNYLYFAMASLDDTASTEQVACFPVSQLSHIEMATTTNMKLFFGSQTEMDNDSGINLPQVGLTVTLGKHKEAMQDLIEAINRPNGGNFGFINIADTEDSVFCSEHITACASITIIDAAP